MRPPFEERRAGGKTVRRKDRDVTRIETVLEIAGKAKILHLGLFDDEYPYVVPLHYGYEYTGGSLAFFMHCANEGRKLDLINRCPNVCVTLECDVEPVSGSSPCGYGSSYASVIGFGRAEIVSGRPEKIKGLKLLMKNQTGRDFTFDAGAADSVAVIKVVISEFTAKAADRRLC